MPRELQFDRTMSDTEALMWRLEKDPYLTSSFASVTICDRVPDVDRLRRRMAAAISRVPRLRQRVQAAPAGIGPPVWVDDRDFDLDHHVRQVALARPGSMRELTELASLVAADPFDRVRPLWQFVVVGGLRGGKGALIQKMHHTMADGEAGVRLSLQFLDLERDAAESLAPGPTLDADEPPAPEPLAIGRDLLAAGFRLPLAVAHEVRSLLAQPTRIPGAGAAAIATIRTIASQLSDTEKAHSPLWTRRSLKRRLETLRVPLEPVKQASARFGGSLNTGFITAAAHAAGAYHDDFGAAVPSLRASMAVSTRTEASGSNAFTLVRLLVPTEKMPIDERFAAIHAASAAAKAATTTGGLNAVATLASTLPTSFLTRLARQQGQTVDFATSNVRGAPFELYLAGAKVLETYPIGPLAGVAFNLTLLSYNGSLDIGLNVDTAAVEDPEHLRATMGKAFAELVRAGS